MTQAAPRDRTERIADTRHRLANDIDAWVATAGREGPWLVPLSFSWDGQRLLFATDADTVTGANLADQPKVRVGLGHTRDVVMIDGDSELSPINTLSDQELADYSRRNGSDPRTWADTVIRITPVRIQAWREEPELAGRTIFGDGHWLT